jgi:hypothetical protein
MTAAVYDYAAIARRMNCDKPQKAAESDEVPLKRKSGLVKRKWPAVRVADGDDDVDEDD